MPAFNVMNESRVGGIQKCLSLGEMDSILIPSKEIKRRKSARDIARKNYEAELSRESFLNYISYFRIVIFGSARIKSDTPDYNFTRKLTQTLVEEFGADIVHGGGPGIMEAAAKGLLDANRSGVKNHGFSITLPFEEQPNPDIHFVHHYDFFGPRITDFYQQSHASYTGKGGIGSFTELFMGIQMKQVKHLESGYPLLAHPLYEKSLRAFYEQAYTAQLEAGETPLVSQGDIDLLTFTDDLQVIVDEFRKAYELWKVIRSKIKIS